MQQEIIDLIKKHISECESKDKARYNEMISVFENNNSNNAKKYSFKNVEMDELKGLKDQDDEIDHKLDRISEALYGMKEHAIEIGNEINIQTMMINEIENKVENNNQNLQNINTRMKSALEKVRKGDKIIIDFILLMILLGLGAYIFVLI